FICCVVVNRRSHRYASFLRLADEEIILRQYSRNLIFAVLVSIYQFQNEGKRVHDPMKDLNKNSRVLGML
ncbi:hypothetical protein, partial [Blautia sp.]|uniref:hypothetical protein n=1 Tax=Blautia sp. TaxID=1955243 RepID=UPI003AB6E2C5